MKRTLIALVAIVTLALSSCNAGKSSSSYESTYLFRPITRMLDTTFIKEDYVNNQFKSAKMYVDTTMGRYFLNRKIMFDETFKVEGDNMYDVDTTMFNLLKDEVLNILPAVKAVNYDEVFASADSVFAGEFDILYEVLNLQTSLVVLRDSITTYTIVKDNE